MDNSFLKYQSLGNDFVVLDWYRKSDPAVQCALAGPDWKQFVIKTCDRHCGVGADGVLVLRHNRENQLPEILVFNADGTSAENCLNGLRSIAHYLFTHYSFPSAFAIKIGQRMVDCIVQGDKDHPESLSILTTVDFVSYHGQRSVQLMDRLFEGYVAYAGNPHFVIFQKTTLDWLRAHGSSLEQHQAFPQRTNVEFVWQEAEQSGHKKYQVLVYERGCGITLACGSGATAILSVLHATGTINTEEKVELVMPGGSIVGWAISDSCVVLQAPASFVFSGSF